MKRFSYIERQENWFRLQHEEFDLLIIGGGITGAGAARDAAMRGMKVALIEAKDFASGTSSRSSKLIHGGIRYLENMEFKLVFEALSERARLFSMVPHLVHPLRFMLPLYKDSRVGMSKMGLGMWLYDALSLFQAPELHERLDAKASLQRMPILKNADLKGSYVYSDAYMDDDRLVYETLRSANEFGAVCLNYAKAQSPIFLEDGSLGGVEVCDNLDGKKIHIKAKHTISSVGPWTDELGAQFFKNWKKILRPTKGIHITLSKQRLPLSSAVVMAAEKSNRIVFGIPRHEMVIVGTTDTDYQESPDEVVANVGDVQYLLHILGQYFPGARIQSEDIIATYAGVRPLVNDGATTEGKTSREHMILSHPRGGLTFVAGGKYTTYRLMAQQTINHVLQHFPIEERVKFPEAATDAPLNPYTEPMAYEQSIDLAPVWARNFQLSVLAGSLLAHRYGMEAYEIINKYGKMLSYWQMEAAQAIETTMCMNLTDFYTRRVHLFLAEPQHGLQYLEGIGQVFQNYFSLSDAQLKEQKQQLAHHIDHELAWAKNFKSK